MAALHTVSSIDRFKAEIPSNVLVAGMVLLDRSSGSEWQVDSGLLTATKIVEDFQNSAYAEVAQQAIDDLSDVVTDHSTALTAAENVVLDDADALRAYLPASNLRELSLVETDGDGTGGRFRLDTADATSADDGVNVIFDATTPTAGRWKRYMRHERIPYDIGFGKYWTDTERRKVVVNVREFNGIDPAGNNSSLAAIQAAVSEYRNFSPSGEPCTAILKFDPNAVAGGKYVLDGSLNMSAIRGNRNMIEGEGSVMMITGAGNNGIDMYHSMSMRWRGGIILGDPAAPPRCGHQGGRILNGGGNPSSHGHQFEQMTWDGSFTTAANYFYASEGLRYLGCSIENNHPAPEPVTLCLDGQSGQWPQYSDFQTVGFGEYTGFYGVDVLRSSARRSVVTGEGGDCVFMCRVSGARFEEFSTQVRNGKAHFKIHNVFNERGCRDIKIRGRFETSESGALVHLSGDSRGVHDSLDITVDRNFPKAVIKADASLNDGDGVALPNLNLQVSNFFPSADLLVFENVAKFNYVTGAIRVANWGSNHQVGFTGSVAVAGLDLPFFKGTISVADMTNIGAFPTGGTYTVDDDSLTRRPRFYKDGVLTQTDRIDKELVLVNEVVQTIDLDAEGWARGFHRHFRMFGETVGSKDLLATFNPNASNTSFPYHIGVTVNIYDGADGELANGGPSGDGLGGTGEDAHVNVQFLPGRVLIKSLISIDQNNRVIIE